MVLPKILVLTSKRCPERLSQGALPTNCTFVPNSVFLTPLQHLACASYCSERDAFLRAPGAGGWHDPDMLLVGNTPCSAAAAAAGLRCFSVPPEVEPRPHSHRPSRVKQPAS